MIKKINLINNYRIFADLTWSFDDGSSVKTQYSLNQLASYKKVVKVVE